MSMEKYGTYEIFQNIDTGEIVRIPITESEEMIKIANKSNWKQLDSEPEENDKATEFNKKSS